MMVVQHNIASYDRYMEDTRMMSNIPLAWAVVIHLAYYTTWIDKEEEYCSIK